MPLALLLATLLAPLPAVASIEFTETQLTNDPSADDDAAVSGPDVVFVSDRGGNTNIHWIDANGHTQRLNNSAAAQEQPDIDAGRVVWTDNRFGGSDIFMMDLSASTPVEEPLILDGANDSQPAISGDNVVFIRRVGAADDVRWINLVTRVDTPVSSSPDDDSAPSIDGNLVAWQALRSGNVDILAAVLGSAPFVVAAGPDHELSPSVSAGRIAFIRSGDVFLYTHATGQTTQLTNDAFQQQRVYLSGNHVLWSDDRNGNQDLFLYDLVDGQTYQLTTEASDQVPTGIDGNTVVFHDARSGDLNVFKITFTINHAPVADAGADQDVFAGDVVQLDGSGSDPDGDAIASFQWAFESRPSGSNAVLSDPSAPNPTFVADLPGVYVLSLVVSDGIDSSSLDTVTVTATERPIPGNTPGCAKGAGTLTTNPKAGFAFGVTYTAGQAAPKGAVGFNDAAARKGIVSTRLTSLTIAGPHVTILGEGRTKDGPTVPFRVDADDLSRNGSVDTFRIEWPGYMATGTLKQGNIVLGCGRKDNGD